MLVTPDWGAHHLAPAGRDHGPGRRLADLGHPRGSGASRRARRGKTRVPRRTPAGIHMPGPSWSPGLRGDRDRAGPLGTRVRRHDAVARCPGARADAPVLARRGHPDLRPRRGHDRARAARPTSTPGHRPACTCPGRRSGRSSAPSASTMLMAGLVFGGGLLLGGVVALILTLVGWLFDALKEYRNAVAADTTGHLDPLPAPRTPSLMLSVLAVLFVAGILLQTGLLPPGSASGGAPGASGSPAPSGSAAPSGAPPPSGGPPPSEPVTGDVDAHGAGHRLHRDRPSRARPTRRSRSPSTTATRACRTTSRSRTAAAGTRGAASRSTASRRRSTTSRRCRPARTSSCARSIRT